MTDDDELADIIHLPGDSDDDTDDADDDYQLDDLNQVITDDGTRARTVTAARPHPSPEEILKMCGRTRAV